MCAQCGLVVVGKARRLALEVWLGDMRLTRGGNVAVRLAASAGGVEVKYKVYLLKKDMSSIPLYGSVSHRARGVEVVSGAKHRDVAAKRCYTPSARGVRPSRRRG